MRKAITTIAAASLLLAACASSGGGAAGASATSAPPSMSESTVAEEAAESQMVDVGGYELWIECRGTGSPTVIYEAGADGDAGWFGVVDSDISETTRTCSYDRAGIERSDPRPTSDPVSAGDIVDELELLLAGADVEGPYVMVGHSFGGMIAQLFAEQHPDEVAGLVFVDSSMAGQLGKNPEDWDDGYGIPLDMKATKDELLAVGSYGSTPMVMLTRDFTATPELMNEWGGMMRELAARSSNSIHVIAVDSGHMIQEDEPDLVVAAIEEVLTAVRDGQPLTPCDDRFEPIGGACAP